MKRSATRYGLAVFAAVIALLLRKLLAPLLGDQNPYHTIWLAVVFCAWYCGLGPAIAAVTISVLGIMFWFLPPYHSFSVQDPQDVFGIVGFLLFSAVIVALGESTRRIMEKRKQAEEELRRAHEELEDRVEQRTLALTKMSTRLLNLQDEERRRIARGLHDSLGQYLASLKINLDVLSLAGGNEAALASECSQIVEKCITETRTISHLLHPPLLDEAGFGSAARWYVEGFSRRSGININLDLPEVQTRLSRDVEIALFRAVQEALTNVHRHSGGTLVNISMAVEPNQVILMVRDNGKGIPRDKVRRLQAGASADSGVGIAGMRERLRELGGSFEIKSTPAGTTLILRTPLVANAIMNSDSEWAQIPSASE